MAHTNSPNPRGEAYWRRLDRLLTGALAMVGGGLLLAAMAGSPWNRIGAALLAIGAAVVALLLALHGGRRRGARRPGCKVG